MITLRDYPLSMAALLLATAVGACADPSSPDPLRVEAVSGADQEAIAGTELPDPLALRVLDEDGNPAAGVSVQWSVVEGSGELSPEAATTDPDGVATARWILGDGEGEQLVRGVVGVAGADFRAVAMPVPVPPESWNDVIALGISAEAADGEISVLYHVANEWTHDIVLRTLEGCLAMPRLTTDEGSAVSVPGFEIGCIFSVTYRTIEAGDSLTMGFSTGDSSLPPGEYVVTVDFVDHLEVNGDPTTLPDLTVDVIVP